MQKTAKVLFIKGRYTTYLDRETASVFYHDQVQPGYARRTGSIASIHYPFMVQRINLFSPSSVAFSFPPSLSPHAQTSAALEKSVTMVQRKWRRMKQRRGDKIIHPRARTEAFSFKPPEELSEQMKLCTAWAYLRRRARLVRQVCGL